MLKAEFDKGLAVKARKAFVHNGRHFAPDAPFPWQQLAITERKAHILYNSGLIVHDGEKAVNGEPVKMPSVNSLTKRQLVDQCKRKGLPFTGKMKALRDRLTSFAK